MSLRDKCPLLDGQTTLNFNEIRQSLESDELYAKTAIANDVRSFVRMISNQPATHSLRLFVEENLEHLEQVSRYARQLLAQAAEGRLRFENDVALAICVFVLSSTASAAAERVLRIAIRTDLSPLVWVTAIARHLEPATSANSSSAVTFEAPQHYGEFRWVKRPTVVDSSQTSAGQIVLAGA